MGLFGWKAPFPCRLGGNAHVNVDASYEAIRANLGDAFTEDENTAEDADTKAGARALGGAAAALEAFVAQVDPRALSTMLPRWEAILGLRASINDTDTERRNRVAARLLANFSGDVDGISRIAAESFYPWTTNLRFNPLAKSVRYWPGGSDYAAGLALSFSTGEYVAIGDVTALDFEGTDPFTLLAWVKTSTSAIGGILGKSVAGGTSQGWGLRMSANGKVRFFLVNDIAATYMCVDSTNTINDGDWHLVAVTTDGTGTVAGTSILIDDEVETLATISDTLSGSIQGGGLAELGRAFVVSWGGQIENIAVFDRVLSSSELTEAYGNGAPISVDYLNPVAWYMMGNGDTYPTITDHGSGGNDGTMTNMVPADIVVGVTPAQPNIDHLSATDWTSTASLIVVEYVRPAFANDDAVEMRRTACLSALDEYAPAWATFTVSESQSVGTNALKQGFFLNQPNIGVSSF